MSRRFPSKVLRLVVLSALMIGVKPYIGQAQVTTNITENGLGTSVSPKSPGGVVTITGGTRPANGTNLFHSFGLFNVGAGDTANFSNNTALATTNILSRVTGGSPSNIFGTIQTTGFGAANLFLINPAGVVFGPNASLDIGRTVGTPGSFHASTADYLRLGTPGAANSGMFSANPLVADILTTAPVTAFGFLKANPAAIAVQGSMLQVGAGTAISVIGGTRTFLTEEGNTVLPGVTMTDGTLSAPSGQINLISVASPGEILIPTMEAAPNINGESFTARGSIQLSAGATVDASGDPGGTVLIRGGQLVLENSTIAASTTGVTNGRTLAVDIEVTGDLAITKNGGGAAIIARSQGQGDAGEIRISANHVTAHFELEFDFESVSPFINALVDSHGTGSGKAGSVTIAGTKIDVQGSFLGTDQFIDSSNSADGRAGDIAITGDQVNLINANINGGGGNPVADIGTGRGANIVISAKDLTFDRGLVSSVAGQGGDITINAGSLSMIVNLVSSVGADRGGNVDINAASMVMDGASILTGTFGPGPGGDVIVSVNTVDLLQGSQIASETFADGPAGQVKVTGTERVSISGPRLGAPSGFFTSSFSTGNAGPITVITPTLEVINGGRINSGTIGDGRGGDVTIVADRVMIAGTQPFIAPDFQFSVFSISDATSSAIFTSTVGGNPGNIGSACVVRCGDAGNVMLSTGVLTLADGARINSGTQNQGKGGNITINASESINLSGVAADIRTGISSTSQDTSLGGGDGGNIFLHGVDVRLSNGSNISAESSGTGNAGDISAQADNSFISHNSTITTSTTHSDGGNIMIKGGSLVQLVNTDITTNVQGGAGSGGNINIDPPTVILNHSKIIASAIGGNGGNINIVAGVFLTSPDSVIDASSTFGISGRIAIESPITSLSSTLAPLPQGFLQVAGLLRARCAARLQQGQSSSFVVAGRDRVPLEPGNLLPTPIFVERVGSTRFAESVKPSELHIGRVFGEQSLTLASLNGRCA